MRYELKRSSILGGGNIGIPFSGYLLGFHWVALFPYLQKEIGHDI